MHVGKSKAAYLAKKEEEEDDDGRKVYPRPRPLPKFLKRIRQRVLPSHFLSIGALDDKPPGF